METGWHRQFSPQEFLKRVDIESLLRQTAVDPESEIHELKHPCFVCSSLQGPGIVLNEGSYLCGDCFKSVSHIEYPETYEIRKRENLVACDAHSRARAAMIENRWEPTAVGWLNFIAAILIVALFLSHNLLSALGIAAVGGFALAIAAGVAFVVARKLDEAFQEKIKEWDRTYPIPEKPILRHFHDPQAELTVRDQKTLYIFLHWPGYPPFWDYLRNLVYASDRNRCQVTGCPSRLSLHAHHIQAISRGGEHSPTNLVSLCQFHHALEPEKGHERVWGDIKTIYFTLVCEHDRSNRVASGTHSVRAHLRRLELISSNELRQLFETYAFACPKCGSTKIKATIYSQTNQIGILCNDCHNEVEGPQELTEETGPKLAELLRVTRNKGRWKARWDMLSQRTSSNWGDWKGPSAVRTRKSQKKKQQTYADRPLCPICGAKMRLVKPAPYDNWKAFWSCPNYKISGCRGTREYKSSSR